MENGNKLIHSFNDSDNSTGHFEGLTKREYMATEAMVGFISSRKDALYIISDTTLEDYAAKSVRMADYLLKQLETTKK